MRLRKQWRPLPGAPRATDLHLCWVPRIYPNPQMAEIRMAGTQVSLLTPPLATLPRKPPLILPFFLKNQSSAYMPFNESNSNSLFQPSPSQLLTPQRNSFSILVGLFLRYFSLFSKCHGFASWFSDVDVIWGLFIMEDEYLANLYTHKYLPIKQLFP